MIQLLVQHEVGDAEKARQVPEQVHLQVMDAGIGKVAGKKSGQGKNNAQNREYRIIQIPVLEIGMVASDGDGEAAEQRGTQKKKQSPLVLCIHFPETVFQFLTIATASRIL